MVTMLQYINIDQIIVLFFLLLTLVVGIIAGKGIKDVKDYAIANRTYGTPVLVLTMLATEIGSGYTTGDTAQVFTDGLIYSLSMGFGYFIGLMLLARYITSKFDFRFNGMLSIADIIKSFYGGVAEKYTGLLGYIYCIAIFAMQLVATGHLAANFLGIDYVYGILITGSLIVFYSVFGGVRAVAITDVLQFAVLIVIVPIIASTATAEVGGLHKVFNATVLHSHAQILDNPRLWEFLALMAYGCLPFHFMQPSFVQRYLMAKNSKQASKITYILGIVSLALMAMISCMSFAALNLFPEIEPKLIISTIINNLLPIGLKGLAVAGMLAVFMSTADSSLNTGGILIAHNVLPESFFKSQKSKLRFMEMCTLISGMLAMVIAMQNYNIISTFIIASTIFASITVPLVFAILKFKINKYCFWACVVVNAITFAILHSYNIPQFATPIICTLISAISFIITYGITTKQLGFPLYTVKSQGNKKPIRFNIIKYLPTPKNILLYSTNKVNKVGADYTAFAIFCCINYIVPFFMWTFGTPNHYPIMLSLRVAAGFLCVGLLLKNYWPQAFKKYFPVYWHLTLMFCLPFITTVMFLLMNANTEWLINLALAILLLAILVDWLSFMLIFTMGIVCGCVFYAITIGKPIVMMDYYSMYEFGYVCVFATLIGIVFTRRKEATSEEKLEVMRLFGSSIAHEVKTPLSVINMNVENIKSLINTASQPREKGKYTLTFDTESFKLLANSLASIIATSSNGTKIIDNILASLKSEVIAEDIGRYSLKKCVEEAVLEACIDRKNTDINYDIASDFTFYGSKNYIKHVFINLINNAFKHGGNNVYIEIKIQDNILLFKDNGKGISEELLPKIFERFFTNDPSGTGIGLAFCKMVMESIGGSIECESKLGQYTCFKLYFPKVKE